MDEDGGHRLQLARLPIAAGVFEPSSLTLPPGDRGDVYVGLERHRRRQRAALERLKLPRWDGERS